MSSKVPDRLDKLGQVTALALREMRKAKPGERDRYSEALANIWMREAGDNERSFLFSTATKAVPDHILDQMVLTLTDPEPGPEPTPGERRWRDWCERRWNTDSPWHGAR